MTPLKALATLNLAKLYNKTYYGDVFHLITFLRSLEFPRNAMMSPLHIVNFAFWVRSKGFCSPFAAIGGDLMRKLQHWSFLLAFFVCLCKSYYGSSLLLFSVATDKKNISVFFAQKLINFIFLTVLPFVSFIFWLLNHDFPFSSSSSHLTQNLCSAHSVLWSFCLLSRRERPLQMCPRSKHVEAAGKPIWNMKWF